MEKNQLELKKAYCIRRDMDCPDRHYVFAPDTSHLVKKEYTYMDSARRLLRFANDSVGTISDCYILYAVGYLGVCDKNTIRIFLRNLQIKHPDLYIEDVEDENSLSRRVAALSTSGFLYATRFNDASLGETSQSLLPTRVYTIDQDASVFMNQKLTKRVPYNKWLMVKPISQLIGWSATAYIGACLSGNKYQVCFLEAVFRNRYLGNYYLPCEQKFYDGKNKYYVAFLDAFLIRDERSQTEHDFAEYEATKLNVIRNYIGARTTEGIACVVVVVENNADLVAMARLIMMSEVLLDNLERIYFTSEGAYNHAAYDKDAFLQMIVKETENDGAQFDFVAVQPPFLY